MNDKSFYILNNLKIGDVVLTNNINNLKIVKSTVQKAYTKGSFTHVLLCVGKNSLIEAVSNGVRFHVISAIAFSDIKNFRVLRYKLDDVPDFSNLLYEGTKIYSHMQYNHEGIRSFFHLDKANPYKTFCSELVAKIYNDCGIDLFNIPTSKVTPAHFENSNKFEIKTEDCSYVVNELSENISLVYDTDKKIHLNISDIQADRISKINSEIINKYQGSIPNMQHLNNLLINYRSLEINNFLKILLSQSNNYEELVANYFKKYSDQSIIDIFEILITLTKKYKLKTKEDIDCFIDKLDQEFYSILNKHDYYNIYKTFQNADKEIVSLNQFNIKKISLEERTKIYDFSLSAYDMYSKIYNHFQKDIYNINKNKKSLNYMSVDAYKKTLTLSDKGISERLFILNNNIITYNGECIVDISNKK